jgi:hypothetical protein
MAIDPRKINSKVLLKVKSGPGVISGIDEVASNNGVVDFSGIQFTEPGDYVISVIPSSPDLEATQFEIKILPEEEFIPQESVGEEKPPIEGSRPIISQINQPTVKLDPMKFDIDIDAEFNKNISTGLGFTPFLWYSGTQIPERDISYLEIYYDDYVPKATVTFKDTLGLVKSPETRPLNDTKFEIFLNSGSDIIKSIHLKFKIEIQQDNKKGSISVTGILDIRDFYKVSYRSYQGSSFEVLRKVSGELDLGFNSNITNTNDIMKWRRNGEMTKEFIKSIIMHSYISDESFVIGYIDYYWCLNYVDIEKEWKRDISNDLAINSQGVSYLSEGVENDKIVPLILTNDPSNNSSVLYFMNHRFNNNSTYFTSKTGVFTESKAYDRIKKQFLKFRIDSQTSDGNVVILKGSQQDTDEINTNYSTSYSGKIDTDNVHNNYLYAVDQNKRNLDELVKISMEMELPKPNFNLYKYQKVNIEFINQKQTISDSKISDERLSGDWLIVDIRYIWSGRLYQKITAVRKELGKTTEEIKSQDTAVQNNNAVNSEINENTIAPGDVDANELVGDEGEDEAPLFIFNDEEPVTDEDVISEEFLEASFDGEEELIESIFVKEELQNEPLPKDTPNKTEELPTGENGVPVDYNDSKFVGGAWKNYNIDNVLSEINSTSHKPNAKFKESLKKILLWIKQDKDITDAREAAYLLATAYAESGYSLQRWEADYVCTGAGIPYGSNGPCQKALNYFRSSKGKKNYYDLGIDSKGFPYFGRGLIQLTGKSNYQKYGDKIGVDLVNNGDLALKEDNSYKIAVIYLVGKTFKHVKSNNLTQARKSVNGGTKGLSEVNGAYNDWLKIFEKSA